jgi:RNA polymerase sigma factor (sigma-70 family)
VSSFPETPATLLVKLAAQVTGEDEANWMRFVDLYVPAIRSFAERHGDGRDADDIVQEVLMGLVAIFRGGRFAVREGIGNFRSYLAKMIRSRLYMAYRREKVRGWGVTVPIGDVDIPLPADSVTAALDVEWASARRHAAVEHALTKTLLSDRNKEIYRAYVLEERPIGDVARTFGVTRNQVSQVKMRVGRMIAALEAEFGD